MLVSPVVSDPTYLLLAVGTLFVHACYQLSVSVLTHFSSHSLSRQTSDRRLFILGTSYGIGAVGVTGLFLFSIVTLTSFASPRLLTVLIAGLSPLIGLATILWYYRKGQGTRIWLPRPVAAYLLERSKKTRSAFEAMLLGAATVIGELPFLVGPLLFAAFLISRAPSATWLSWTGLYSFLAYLPLFVITMYITSGHSVAKLQKWREESKSFLQWASGSMLILLTIYFTLLQLGATS